MGTHHLQTQKEAIFSVFLENEDVLTSPRHKLRISDMRHCGNDGDGRRDIWTMTPRLKRIPNREFKVWCCFTYFCAFVENLKTWRWQLIFPKIEEICEEQKRNSREKQWQIQSSDQIIELQLHSTFLPFLSSFFWIWKINKKELELDNRKGKHESLIFFSYSNSNKGHGGPIIFSLK